MNLPAKKMPCLQQWLGFFGLQRWLGVLGLFLWCLRVEPVFAQDQAAESSLNLQGGGQQANAPARARPADAAVVNQAQPAGSQQAMVPPAGAIPTGVPPASGAGSQEPQSAQLKKGIPNVAELATYRTVRRFHEVLNELLAEFTYDVKTNQLKDIGNLSIRRVSLSESLPKSYQDYLELLIVERIREHSKLKVISCMACKTKSSRIVDGKLYIYSPLTNVSEMLRAADQLGIDHFMDVVMVYHTTHMVLAFQVFNVATKEMVWARTYNSETIGSRYQRYAVDYSQIAKARSSDEYAPEFRYLLGLGGGAVPNVAGTAKDSNMLALGVRGTEKFDNRQHEFGMQLMLYFTVSSLLSGYPSDPATDPNAAEEQEVIEVTTEATPEPFSTAIGLYPMYARHFSGELESYDRLRVGLNVGLGAILASGYFAGSARAGADFYFGRRFVLSVAGVYIASSQILVEDELRTTAGGAGADILVSYNL